MAKEEQLLTESLKNQFDTIKNNAVNYHNNPYLPKNVHQYRVQMRRVRAMLNFLKAIIDKNLYQSVNESLREQGRDLSPIREMDVYIEEVNDIASERPQLTEHYLELFRFLENKRLNLINQKSSKKEIKTSKEKIAEVEEQLKSIEFNLKNTKEDSVSDFIEKRFAERVKKLEKEYEKITADDYQHTHETRKLAKKIRYASDSFEEFLPKKQSKKINKRTKKIQEELGAVTDKHVNRSMTEQYMNILSGGPLKETFQRLLTVLSEPTN